MVVLLLLLKWCVYLVRNLLGSFYVERMFCFIFQRFVFLRDVFVYSSDILSVSSGAECVCLFRECLSSQHSGMCLFRRHVEVCPGNIFVCSGMCLFRGYVYLFRGYVCLFRGCLFRRYVEVCTGNSFVCSGICLFRGYILSVQGMCFSDIFVQGMCLSFSDIFVCSGDISSGDMFKYVQGIYICLFRRRVWCASDLLWRDVLHCYLPQERLPSGHKVPCLTLTHVPDQENVAQLSHQAINDNPEYILCKDWTWYNHAMSHPIINNNRFIALYFFFFFFLAQLYNVMSTMKQS